MQKNLYVPWKESSSHCIALLTQRQVNENSALRVGLLMSTGASQRRTVLFLDQEKWINLQPHNLFHRTQKFVVTVCSLCIMMQLAVSEKITLWYMDPLFHQCQEDIQHWKWVMFNIWGRCLLLVWFFSRNISECHTWPVIGYRFW